MFGVKNAGRRWFKEAACHFPKKHTSFHEKRGLLWHCSWCETMLKRFRIFAQEQEDTDEFPRAYWGEERTTGKLWKIHGTESWKEAAWRLPDPDEKFKGIV